ncbi:tetratricopeptide repeat protein [Candidatus Odyssella thessalonicensis]|uniref:tetratricopeptide repeat protein n=1 Tax=Candidatus Odyssella thessalonicensis TaxID=84647 RepID=UPI000225BD9C|nr:tetratricopeptide repeat protein [Candidatus Odyssella thessalonicensis]
MTYLHTKLAALVFFLGLPYWALAADDSPQTQYIALYRGIHFFKGIFAPSDITRAINSCEQEQNSHPLFSSTAGTLIGANYLTNPDNPALLLRSGELVHNTLKRYKEQHPEHYYLFHQTYTNNHYRFHTLLGDKTYPDKKGASTNITAAELEAFKAYKEIFFEEAEDPKYKLGSINEKGIHRNCFVSFSQGPEHALKYALGLKYMVGEFLRPNYNAQGVPENEYLGKLYIALLKKQDFYALTPTSVLDLHAQRKLKIKVNQDDILAEAEVSFLGYLGQEYVSCAVAIQVPSFNNGYTAEYEERYGLNQTSFLYFKNLKERINEKEFLKELLEKYIIPAYSKRLSSKVAEILQRKQEGSVLTFIGYGEQLGEVFPSAMSHILHQLYALNAAVICPGKNTGIGNLNKKSKDTMVRRFSFITEHVSQSQALMLTIKDYSLSGLGSRLKPLLGSTLEVLSLVKLGLNSKDAAQIAEALKSNTSLTELNLDNNPIKDEGSKAIAEALKNNRSLQTLQITNTQTTAEGLASFGALLEYKNGKQKNTSLIKLLYTDVKNISSGILKKISGGLRRNNLKQYSTAAAMNETVRKEKSDDQDDLMLQYLKDKGITLTDLQVAFASHPQPELQDSNEQFLLGVKYFLGVQAPADYVQAAHWFKKAAEQGVANSQYCLAMMHMEGRGIPKNYRLAVYWFEKAAKQDVTEAQYNLGTLYHEGTKVLKDSRKAVFWYKKAAAKGHAEAQCNLGWMYQKGDGTEKDMCRAMYYYIESARRGQGFAGAQYNLGVVYENGQDGIERNGALAKLWYKKAAKQGYADAQFKLGAMHEHGKVIAKDGLQAVFWYEAAAKQGHREAQFNLGWMYGEGSGVAKDEARAVLCYQAAAAQDHKEAQCNLGVMYKEGRGIEADNILAEYWLKQAAKQKYAQAQFYLGMLYEQDLKGIKKNLRLSELFYLAAAEQGHASAQYNLGIMYFEKGDEREFPKAIHWLQSAAKNGVEEAAHFFHILKQTSSQASVKS